MFACAPNISKHLQTSCLVMFVNNCLVMFASVDRALEYLLHWNIPWWKPMPVTRFNAGKRCLVYRCYFDLWGYTHQWTLHKIPSTVFPKVTNADGLHHVTKLIISFCCKLLSYGSKWSHLCIISRFFSRLYPLQISQVYQQYTPLAVVSRARKTLRISTTATIPAFSSKEGAVIGAVLSTWKFHRVHHWHIWIIAE
jgi:hypothetical protein